MSKADPKSEEQSFEAHAERLATIVSQLEKGDLPLESSLALFEEGVKLARAAQAKIESAERRVEELLGFDTEGKPVTKPVTRGDRGPKLPDSGDEG